jgi:restriction endonuclease
LKLKETLVKVPLDLEKVKINCGEKHFESLGTGVIFKSVDDYDKIKELLD